MFSIMTQTTQLSSDTPSLAPFRFYGRRRGRTLRPYPQLLMDTLFPRLALDSARLTLDRSVPLWLEIGFGGGEHLALQAQHHPQVQFIGVEPFLNGVARFLEAVDQQGLTNVRIYMDDVRKLLPLLPDGTLHRVFILFPDPWPKVRHHKRRLIQKDFLQLLSRKMAPGALLCLASDHAEYIEWMVTHLADVEGFEDVTEDPTQPPALWTQTRYQHKGILAGRPPQFLTYQVRP